MFGITAPSIDLSLSTLHTAPLECALFLLHIRYTIPTSHFLSGPLAGGSCFSENVFKIFCGFKYGTFHADCQLLLLPRCLRAVSWGQLACNPPTSPPTQTDGADAPTSAARLKEVATASLDGGVLDAKWSQQPSGSNSTAVLACATSTGRLVLYSLSDGGEGEEQDEEDCVEFLQLASSDAGDNLLLSLDWNGELLADAKV